MKRPTPASISGVDNASRSATFTSTSTPPSSVPQTARVVIVGGGPIGLYAAAMLHGLNFSNITVLERLPQNLSVDVSRGHIFGLNLRGRRALQRLPAPINDVLRNATSVPDGYKFCIIPRVGKAQEYSPNQLLGKKLVPSTLFYRATFVSALREYVETLCGDNIKFIYDAKVKHVSLSHDGDDGGGDDTASNGVRVHYEHRDEELFVEADLVLACDGVNSEVVASLQKQQKDRDISVSVDNPFDKFTVPRSTELRRSKSMVLTDDALDLISNIPDNAGSTHWSRVKGKSFDMWVLPMLRRDRDALGGLIAEFSLLQSHPLWHVASVDQLYTLLCDNFGQIDMRKCLTKEAAIQFMCGRHNTPAPISRVNALTANVQRKYGVVVLGDAAHSMPPDLGEGLNSGLEDVSRLVDAIVAQRRKKPLSVHKVLTKYERRRMPEVKALIRLLTFAGYTVPEGATKWRRTRMRVDRVVREKGNEIVPWVIDPLPGIMVKQGVSYDVVCWRQRKTTIILILLCVAIVMAFWYALIMTAMTAGGAISSFWRRGKF